MNKGRKGIYRFIKSFGYASQGVKYAVCNEQNILVMFVLGIIAIVLGFVLKITYLEKLIIIIMIGVILPLELINTAIEAVVDLHDGDNKSKYGKVAKDCASGALLVASLIALIIGIMIFMPRIIAYF